LLAFHGGAFVAAARAGAPVVPIAVCGTRAVLPDPARPLRRHPLAVEVGVALQPPPRCDLMAASDDLRQRARTFIAARCGEPDVAPTAVPGDAAAR
jgi:1-acyl-sn-glycerol-3-phosphate acyltransferase